MKCERCQVEMAPRTVEYNGRDYDFPYCERCEAQMKVDADQIKESDARKVRKRTDPA